MAADSFLLLATFASALLAQGVYVATRGTFVYATRKAVPSSNYTGWGEQLKRQLVRQLKVRTCEASSARSAGDRSEATTRRIAER